jgi:hypothetical protein
VLKPVWSQIRGLSGRAVSTKPLVRVAEWPISPNGCQRRAEVAGPRRAPIFQVKSLGRKPGWR